LWRLAKTALFSFSTVPLAVFSWIGYTSLGVFLALSGYSLYCKLLTELAVPGWASSVLVGSFFGAVNALGISILGEYVVRIYDQVRGRPLYLIESTRNLCTTAAPAAGPAARAPSATAGRAIPEAELQALEAAEQLMELVAAGHEAARR
jgi:hypothetical protein